jgi:hypothetical protein
LSNASFHGFIKTKGQTVEKVDSLIIFPTLASNDLPVTNNSLCKKVGFQEQSA